MSFYHNDHQLPPKMLFLTPLLKGKSVCYNIVKLKPQSRLHVLCHNNCVYLDRNNRSLVENNR